MLTHCNNDQDQKYDAQHDDGDRESEPTPSHTDERLYRSHFSNNQYTGPDAEESSCPMNVNRLAISCIVVSKSEYCRMYASDGGR